MIEESLIVKDTRKIRCSISEQFDNNVDLYVDYLLSNKVKTGKLVEYKTGINEKEKLTQLSR